ncbi:MAG TPA: GreA/GreB family elongation factor [Verrucomicrobiae bacterium]|jgi:transcription elongation factor GreB|nr:GreA/GreB family elongation factor [Verrucomicrobiae bacterium]
MSKAFTRESDDAPDPLPAVRPFSVPGGKNYLTPAGAKNLENELGVLLQKSQDLAASSSDDNKRARQSLLPRISYLQQSLAAAVISPPPEPPWEQIFFGATVKLRGGDGEEASYRIVGVDEMDLDRNWVSWTSPIARALLKKQLGQQVKFKMPAGEQDWTIVEISYE